MVYTVSFTKQAAKTLRKLPADVKTIISNKIGELVLDPNSQQLDIEKLKGRDGYRLRVGNWRIIYDLFQHQLHIVVIKIGDRKEVYK